MNKQSIIAIIVAVLVCATVVTVSMINSKKSKDEIEAMKNTVSDLMTTVESTTKEETTKEETATVQQTTTVSTTKKNSSSSKTSQQSDDKYSKKIDELEKEVSDLKTTEKKYKKDYEVVKDEPGTYTVPDNLPPIFP